MSSAQPATLGLTVETIDVSEPGVPPSNIIPQGGEFQLALNFETVGPTWHALGGQPFHVQYFVEGLGKNADEEDFGPVIGTLKAGPAKYDTNETKYLVPAASNTLKPGVYRVAAVLTFPTIPGIAGFAEDQLIQIF